MLKWILILLKALSIVGAVVSMKRAESRGEWISAQIRESIDFEMASRNWESKFREADRIRATVVTLVNELQDEKRELKTRVEELVGSERAFRLRAKVAESMAAQEDGYDTCLCRGCTVLRANTHGYADRMRGAIRRDIEAESG